MKIFIWTLFFSFLCSHAYTKRVEIHFDQSYVEFAYLVKNKSKNAKSQKVILRAPIIGSGLELRNNDLEKGRLNISAHKIKSFHEGRHLNCIDKLSQFDSEKFPLIFSNFLRVKDKLEVDLRIKNISRKVIFNYKKKNKNITLNSFLPVDEFSLGCSLENQSISSVEMKINLTLK